MKSNQMRTSDFVKNIPTTAKKSNIKDNNNMILRCFLSTILVVVTICSQPGLAYGFTHSNNNNNNCFREKHAATMEATAHTRETAHRRTSVGMHFQKHYSVLWSTVVDPASMDVHQQYHHRRHNNNHHHQQQQQPQFEQPHFEHQHYEQHYQQQNRPQKQSECLMREDNNNDYDNNCNFHDDWLPTVGGGFIPKIKHNNKRIALVEKSTGITVSTPPPPSSSPSPPLVQEVVTIQEFKKVVMDESDKIVVVRFHAPWCRACRATGRPFRQVASKFRHKNVKFVEVPVTKETVRLQDALGVPNVPYGHIYHPHSGLVEELKMTKKYFKNFLSVLQTYVDGECSLLEKEEEEEAFQ